MKTRKTNTTTTTTTTTTPKPATLLAALAALTLAGAMTAEARTQRADRGTSPVTTIAGEDIRQTGVTNVGELVNQLPNVTNGAYGNTNGNPYGTSNVDLRGLGNDRTLTLVNGRRYVPNQEIYGPDAGFIPSSAIEQVEVLRGPQGTLYGRNANGGVINVITRGGNQNNTGYTTGEDYPYNVGAGYRFNENYTNTLNFDPKGLGTNRFDTRLDAGLNYGGEQTGYDTGRIDNRLNYGDTPLNTNPVTLNPETNPGYQYEWTPELTTAGAGLNTTLNPVGTTDTPTQTTDTPVAGTTPTTTCPETGQPINNTTVDTTQSPNNDVYGWGGYNTYQSNGSPCDRYKIDWDRVRQQMSIQYREDAAGTARGLIYQSQPKPFFDFNYHNTANDELYNRDVIGSQLSQSLTVNHGANASGNGIAGCIAGDPTLPNGGLPPSRDPVAENAYQPQFHYLVGGGMIEPIPVNDDEVATSGDDTETASTATATTTEPQEDPIPEYKPTVRPIDVDELSDTQLEIEIEYGGSITAGYLREAKDLRDDATRYRDIAKTRREQAARARADAEEARKKAKDPNRRADSREFWEQQAENYDSHAEILEENARIMDRSAANNDAAAESYEQDAAQSAENLGKALGERANRIGQKASAAARAQAAREAEAARKEAERQKRLADLIRQSQTNTQNNTNNQGNSSGGVNPSGRSGPDMREPQIGREPRNETLRKLLD